MPTLAELYEETNSKRVSYKVIVGSNVLLQDRFQNDTAVGSAISISWSFDIGSAVPTATIVFPGQAPVFLKTFSGGRRPNVQIYAGYNGTLTRQFTGLIMDIAQDETTTTLSCVGESQALEVPFERVVKIIDNESAVSTVRSLLEEGVGIFNHEVDFPDWTIATVEEITLELSTYGEAVNKIAQVTGSNWYEMPSGQIRVELRDPIPAGMAFRQYFSGYQSALDEAEREAIQAGNFAPLDLQPPGITNPNAYPRLREGSVEIRDFPRNVRNRVNVLGRTLATTEIDGSITTEQLEQTGRSSSPWIENPPEFISVTISSELLDTQDLVDDMAYRYTELYNRLETIVSLTVDGDPEIALGRTVEVIDLDYSGITGRWFIQSYSCQIADNGYSTQLELRGGPFSGTTPLLDPNACFLWNTADFTSKSKQVHPDLPGLGVFVSFDGGCSSDPDGTIVAWDWADDQGNAGSGQTISFIYDPEDVAQIEMTLTVTDNDGLTDSVTKVVQINTNDCNDDLASLTNIFVAADQWAMASNDGGQTWVDLEAEVGDLVGVGKFISVAATPVRGNDNQLTGQFIAFYGTDNGRVVYTLDNLATHHVIGLHDGTRINSILPFQFAIYLDGSVNFIGGFFAGTENGRVFFVCNIGPGYIPGTEYQRFLVIFPNERSVKQLLYVNGFITALGGDTVDPNSLMWWCEDFWQTVRFDYNSVPPRIYLQFSSAIFS